MAFIKKFFLRNMFINSQLVNEIFFLQVLFGLFHYCKKRFFCRLKQQWKIINDFTLLYIAKMSQRYQMNQKDLKFGDGDEPNLCKVN